MPSSSSTPTDASVRIASVRRGMISETAPTKVVFPAPNPPAITIFVDAALVSEGTEATQRPSDQLTALPDRRMVIERRQYAQIARLHQIADQNPRHTHRQVETSRDLGHRRPRRA